MLDYPNILKEPYPDIRDEVTGEWLPASYSVLSAQQAEFEQNAQNRSMIGNLLSIFK